MQCLNFALIPADPVDLANKSPTGFAWGYGGSGPAQLALAILAHYLADDRKALECYQTFKDAVIAHFDQDKPWTLRPDEIRATLAKLQEAE